MGDRVRHAARPEWGEGVVAKITPAVVAGTRTHRLSIRFARAGLKQIAASVGALEPADGPAGSPPGRSTEVARAASGGIKPELSDDALLEQLRCLPASVTDAGLPLPDRVEAA
ncbi:MAG: DUF3553 domain-containing protein, partial [Planctomycetota bacterium]